VVVVEESGLGIIIGSSTECVPRSCLVWTVNTVSKRKGVSFLTAVVPCYMVDDFNIYATDVLETIAGVKLKWEDVPFP